MKLFYKSVILCLFAWLPLAVQAQDEATKNKYTQFLQEIQPGNSRVEYDLPTHTFTITYSTKDTESEQKTITFHENELPALAQETAENINTIDPRIPSTIVQMITDEQSVRLLAHTILKIIVQNLTPGFGRAYPVIMHPTITYDWLLQELQKLLPSEEVQELTTYSTSHPLLTILKEVSHKYTTDYAMFLAKCLAYKYAIKQGIHITQTEAFSFDLLCDTLNDFPFLSLLIENERTALHNNKFSFVHGVSAQRAFALDVYTQCWAIKYKQQLDQQFLIFHRTHPQELCQNGLATISWIHRMDQDGIPEYVRRKHYDELLFLNAPLFGNITRPGSCSALYALRNNNAHHADIQTTYETLHQFGLGLYYNQYKADFDELAKLHATATADKGIIMQLIGDQEAIKHIELAISGGFKHTLLINKRYPTKNIQTILHAMRTNINSLDRCDQFEFVVPKNSISPEHYTIHRHYFGSQEAVETYYKKRDKLFAKIAADYAANPPSRATKAAQSLTYTAHHIKQKMKYLIDPKEMMKLNIYVANNRDTIGHKWWCIQFPLVLSFGLGFKNKASAAGFAYQCLGYFWLTGYREYTKKDGRNYQNIPKLTPELLFKQFVSLGGAYLLGLGASKLLS